MPAKSAEAIAEPGGARLTWAGLNERITTVARALAGTGVEPGDRVAVWLPNDSYWVLAALGALSMGPRSSLCPRNSPGTRRWT